jgi:hypothetical protein
MASDMSLFFCSFVQNYRNTRFMKHKPPLIASVVFLGILALGLAVIGIAGGVAPEPMILGTLVCSVTALSTASLVFAVVSLRSKRTAGAILIAIVSGIVAAFFLFLIVSDVYELLLHDCRSL